MSYLDNDIKNQLTEQKNKVWDDELTKLNPSDNSFWQTAKLFRKNRTKIPNLKQNNTDYTTDQEKADILSDTFQKAHILHQTNNNFHKEVEKTLLDLLNKSHNVTDFNQLQTNPSEIKPFINRLANNKSPGTDGIDNKLLKNLS